MKRTLSTVAIIAASAALLAACSSPESAPKADDAAASSSAPAEKPAESKAPEAKEGTREKPYPAGTTVEIDDWKVAVAATNKDATEIVKKENEFNEVPDGQVPVMTSLTTTYTGADSGTPFMDLQLNFVSNAGKTYGAFGGDTCGLIPEDFMSVGELYKDASATGNVCVLAPAAEVEGGTWVLEPMLNIHDVKTFVALQ